MPGVTAVGAASSPASAGSSVRCALTGEASSASSSLCAGLYQEHSVLQHLTCPAASLSLCHCQEQHTVVARAQGHVGLHATVLQHTSDRQAAPCFEKSCRLECVCLRGRVLFGRAERSSDACRLAPERRSRLGHSCVVRGFVADCMRVCQGDPCCVLGVGIRPVAFCAYRCGARVWTQCIWQREFGCRLGFRNWWLEAQRLGRRGRLRCG